MNKLESTGRGRAVTSFRLVALWWHFCSRIARYEWSATT